MYLSLPLFLAAFAVVFGTAFLLLVATANLPFGLGIFPAGAAALVLAFLGGQSAVRRVEDGPRLAPPRLRDFGAAIVVLVAYFVASTAAAVVFVFTIGALTSIDAIYLATLVVSAVVGVLAARFAAATLAKVSRGWFLFAGAVAAATIGVVMAIGAREMTSQWLFLLAQQGVLLVSGFWMLTPQPLPNDGDAN